MPVPIEQRRGRPGRTSAVRRQAARVLAAKTRRVPQVQISVELKRTGRSKRDNYLQECVSGLKKIA